MALESAAHQLGSIESAVAARLQGQFARMVERSCWWREATFQGEGLAAIVW